MIFKCGISCITDNLFREEENYKTLRENAEKYEYNILSIELKCPEDIRLERFRERIKRAKADPNSKISVTDESVFLENMKLPIYFPEGALVFDTSIQDVQEISKEVLQHLHDRIKACE